MHSSNIELQRSAALAFAEITEKYIRNVGKEILEPILVLLQSPDPDVQRGAGAALGNLAVNNANKKLIVEMNFLEPLKKQMTSPNVEVQCNAVGCLTNLATLEENKNKIANSGALLPLTALAKSKDMRVQRNATGALLNMTHSDENRKQLVKAGAVPVIVSLLSSTDPDVQYYCTTALSNLAVDPENRKNLTKSEPRLVSQLVKLVGNSTSARVQCQAALALRNLASDVNYQLEIVQCGGLPPILQLLQSPHDPLILAAVACIRNVSIHPANERAIVEAGFLKPLVDLVGNSNHEEILCHAVSSMRNLAAVSEQTKLEILDAGVVQKITEKILSAPPSVQGEMSACLAVLALGDELKEKLFSLGVIEVLIPLTLTDNMEVQGNSAAALGNLSAKVSTYEPFVRTWEQPSGGIRSFLTRFLSCPEPTFEHISAWMIVQLLEAGDKRLKQLIKETPEIVDTINKLAERDTGNSIEDVDSSYSPQRAITEIAKKVALLLNDN